MHSANSQADIMQDVDMPAVQMNVGCWHNDKNLFLVLLVHTVSCRLRNKGKSVNTTSTAQLHNVHGSYEKTNGHRVKQPANEDYCSNIQVVDI